MIKLAMVSTFTPLNRFKQIQYWPNKKQRDNYLIQNVRLPLNRIADRLSSFSGPSCSGWKVVFRVVRKAGPPRGRAAAGAARRTPLEARPPTPGYPCVQSLGGSICPRYSTRPPLWFAAVKLLSKGHWTGKLLYYFNCKNLYRVLRKYLWPKSIFNVFVLVDRTFILVQVAQINMLFWFKWLK